MFAYRTQVYPLLHWYTVLPAVLSCRHAVRILIYRYTHSNNHIPPCPAMLCCIPLSTGIYRTFPPAPPHMPFRRSYFNSNGLLLSGYKYPSSIVKMRYSLILTVSRLSGDIRLFGCCNRGRCIPCTAWGGVGDI